MDMTMDREVRSVLSNASACRIELLVQEHRNLKNIGHPFKPFHKQAVV